MQTFWKKMFFAVAAGVASAFLIHNIGVGFAVFVVILVTLWVPIYISYAHDNPKHVWFKRKMFGWGWTPVTWQGWAVLAVYVVLVFLLSLTIDKNSPPREYAFTFFVPLAVLTALLIRIAYRKGEKPGWEWGDRLGKYMGK